MQHPKLRDQKRLLVREPYPLNEIPDEIKRHTLIKACARTNTTAIWTTPRNRRFASTTWQKMSFH